MLVVLLVAAAVILIGMIVVAIGRGGELTEFEADVRPVDAHIETAADVALLRPPVALWGYDRRSTDEALNLVARTVTERDVEIATLRRQIEDMHSARENLRATQPGATGGPGSFGGPGQAGEPGSGLPPVAGSAPPSASPPGETQPWSAWERSEPMPPDHGEPAEPGETG